MNSEEKVVRLKIVVNSHHCGEGCPMLEHPKCNLTGEALRPTVFRREPLYHWRTDACLKVTQPRSCRSCVYLSEADVYCERYEMNLAHHRRGGELKAEPLAQCDGAELLA